MDNVVRIVYREAMDMPPLINPKTYKKAKSNEDLHIKRIKAILNRVEDSSGGGSAVHLDFCLTGYRAYGKHFICATWPKHPSKVDFYFNSNLDYEGLFEGWIQGPRKGKAEHNPESVIYSYSRDFKALDIEYMFFRENPHLQHRPYLFNMMDERFNRRNQDDNQVLAHHKEGIVRTWESSRDMVDKVANGEMSVDQLVELSSLLCHFYPGKIKKALDVE